MRSLHLLRLRRFTSAGTARGGVTSHPSPPLCWAIPPPPLRWSFLPPPVIQHRLKTGRQTDNFNGLGRRLVERVFRCWVPGCIKKYNSPKALGDHYKKGYARLMHVLCTSHARLMNILKVECKCGAFFRSAEEKREHMEECPLKGFSGYQQYLDYLKENRISDKYFHLSPAGRREREEECLQRLKNRIDVAYDSSNAEHQDALRDLWNIAFTGQELRELESWKEMGLARKRSLHRLRGGRFISLENFLYFARNYPKSFQDFLRKQEGDWAIWEYPFAVAGVNITFMLIEMLDLEAVKPQNDVGATFLKFLADNESAFDLLYCITFKLLDNQLMDAYYMGFNNVMKTTRRQLEKELLRDDVTRLEDLPSYRLLRR